MVRLYSVGPASIDKGIVVYSDSTADHDSFRVLCVDADRYPLNMCTNGG